MRRRIQKKDPEADSSDGKKMQRQIIAGKKICILAFIECFTVNHVVWSFRAKISIRKI